jgi:hypothetical protein
MTTKLRSLVLLAAALVGSAGCDDAPTTAVVENGYAAPDAGGAGPTSVYEVWWVTTLFPAAVAPGALSETERTIPATDFAYALLAPGWTPADGGTPPRLVAVRSAEKISAAAHDRLRIVVSDETFVGDCARGRPLDAADARFIVERIFPGPFAGKLYDPVTCSTASVSAQDGPAPADAARGDLGDTDAPEDAGAVE